MTLSAIHNTSKQGQALAAVVCDIGEIWLCQLFTTVYFERPSCTGCLWYRRDMTLSAIHNIALMRKQRFVVVCDIGEIWLCQLFTTRSLRRCLPTRCLWYRRDMTLSAIHNPLQARGRAGWVVCDIGEIWLCQLFTTEGAQTNSCISCLWYRRDMTLSAIHNRARAIRPLPAVVCDIGEIWLCQLFTTEEVADGVVLALFVI